MLADLALGGAIRHRVGLALPMPTVSMTIQLTGRPVREVRWAEGECAGWGRRSAGARSRLFSETGVPVADAVGVFALPRLPYEGSGREMPWDLPLDEPVVPGEEPLAEQDDREDSLPGQAQLVESIDTHAASRPEVAWATQHVMDRMGSHDGSHELDPSAAMVNRLGHIQGGVLFTAAVLAVARQSGFSVESLSTGTIEFIAAAELGSSLVPRVNILRAGGRSLFATVVLEQGGRVCSHVSLVLRR